MAVKTIRVEGGVCAPQGFIVAGVAAGIKKSGARDVALLACADGDAVVAGVGTTNRVCAPSVRRNREILVESGGRVRAVVVNAGCANVATGPRGVADNTAMATAVERALGAGNVLTASTGVIGVHLPMPVLEAGIASAAKALSPTAQAAAETAEAIMTTDLVPKECAVEFEIGGVVARVGGMAKGSGMIAPNMATMLAFVTTDVAIRAPVLDKALRRAVDLSFHALTVDGDTSTSDQCIVLSSGRAGNPVLEDASGPDYDAFLNALVEVCVDLARKIARDGEGATKLATVTVSGARSEAEARQVAKTIAESPLVKTALYGNDPNWGRLMAAAGRAGVDFEPEKASATLAGVEVFRNGVPTVFDKTALSQAMRVDELPIEVDLGTGGDGRFTFFTCDFSYDYVRINAEYTT